MKRERKKEKSSSFQGLLPHTDWNSSSSSLQFASCCRISLPLHFPPFIHHPSKLRYLPLVKCFEFQFDPAVTIFTWIWRDLFYVLEDSRNKFATVHSVIKLLKAELNCFPIISVSYINLFEEIGFILMDQ
ncbi:hypothetical protein Ahy_B03g062346 isoform D [Arachis hypogaea]|uniref:Uncharacterized protein n=1 Tax=Arachis hypogaea TaxID=3818 RepID=A0A444ZUB7_ARAHY|nr:hypothetical protein Ahy_B03g062346 isoform A [Arachis hypogaea]RYR17643.1 hypothetical protein Ahy_B03g062346 isoform B [Arachis hypogaea]RYR17644.1 hypothetical protein Ahy_B03g062346 isoform D [Arachis hypogaea]